MAEACRCSNHPVSRSETLTDPSLRLNPMPRNVPGALAAFSSVEGSVEGSPTVREGADHFGDLAAALRAPRQVRVCTPEVYWRLLTGGSLGGRPRPGWTAIESHSADDAVADSCAQRRGAGASECGFRLRASLLPSSAPLDSPQHPRPGAGEHCGPLRPRQRILCPLSG